MMEVLYPDIPRIYTAVAEWIACMVYISLLKKRISGSRLIFSCTAFLAFQCFLMHVTRNAPIALWLPCMAAAAGSMFLFLYQCCKLSKRAAGYCAARAFLMAELAASLEWQLHCYVVFYCGMDALWIRMVLLICVYGLVFGIGWQIEKRLVPQGYFSEISKRELWSAIVIVAAAFAFSNLSFIYQDSPFSGRFTADIYNIRTLVDLGGLAVLYAYQSRVSELYAEQELNAINAMLKSQYEHYRYYQDSYDMINIKYHDLKHQIAGLRGEEDPRKREEWLDAIEEELNIYDTANQTGNKVLDTMLRSKQLYCKQHNISLTCVADGEILNFIHVTDLCTIFGNALDNAIENVITLAEQERRLIHVSVSLQKSFVFILIENYCENEINTKDVLLVTTKADKKNHGFGIKSMRYSAEKYGGTLSASLRDHWFELKILIPANYE